jgi:hypothetical protein
VRRLSTMFETRLVEILGGMLTQRELAEIDYEVTPAPFPFQAPDGSMGVGMGINVSLAAPTMAIGDHVLITGMIQDPYAIDAILTSNIGELLAGLRKMRTEANSVTNGGLAMPPGARRP